VSCLAWNRPADIDLSFPEKGMFSIFSDEGFTMSNRRCKEVRSRRVMHMFPPNLNEYVAADDQVRTIDAHAGRPGLQDNGRFPGEQREGPEGGEPRVCQGLLGPVPSG